MNYEGKLTYNLMRRNLSDQKYRVSIVGKIMSLSILRHFATRLDEQKG